MSTLSKTARRSLGRQSVPGSFKRDPASNLIVSYGQGRYARIASVDGPTFPRYDVGSDEFYDALSALVENGYEGSVETQLNALGWENHLEVLRNRNAGGEEAAEAA